MRRAATISSGSHAAPIVRACTTDGVHEVEADRHRPREAHLRQGERPAEHAGLLERLPDQTRGLLDVRAQALPEPPVPPHGQERSLAARGGGEPLVLPNDGPDTSIKIIQDLRRIIPVGEISIG
jgi:hypothetical protein